ncbi:MAG: pitrilysin family protein [Acidobacteriota bacterium]|jgi:zinc protease
MSASAGGFHPQRFVLDNGLTVLQQDNATSPAVSISMHLAAGAAFESAPRTGLAGFTAAMLKRGTEQRSKTQIGEHLDFTGALLSGSAARHTASVGAKARVADFESTLELLAECVMTPTFPVPEVEKLRGDLLTAIREDRDDTRQMVSDLLRAAIYPADHPYAWRLLGTEETVADIDRDDLVAFHHAHYGPGGAVLVVVGGVALDRVRKAVGNTLGGWVASTGAQGPDGGGLPAALPRISDVAGPTSRETVVHTMRNKAQADLAIGHPGLRRLDDDYYAARVMNMILGSFAMGGRLGRIIREEKGMAYYAYSAMQTGVGPGPFVVRAGVHPSNVDAATACALEELERIGREPVSAEELSDAKSAMVRSLPRQLETNEGIAGALHSIEQYRLGLDYMDRFPGLIDAVDAEQVMEVAARRLHPDRCAVVVAGPYPLEDVAVATTASAGNGED